MRKVILIMLVGSAAWAQTILVGGNGVQIAGDLCGTVASPLVCGINGSSVAGPASVIGINSLGQIIATSAGSTYAAPTTGAANQVPTVDGAGGWGTSTTQYAETTQNSVTGTPVIVITPARMNVVNLNLSGSVTSSTTSGTPLTGQSLILNVCQPVGGTLTFVPPATFLGFNAVDPSTSACTSQTFHWNSTNWIANDGVGGGAPALVTSGGHVLLEPDTKNDTLALLGAANVFTSANSFTGGMTPPVGTSDPGTCTVGQLYFRSDLTAGQNVRGCTSSNVWTAQGAAKTITYTVSFTFDGGGATIASNSISYKRIPVASHIVGWTVDAVGSSPADTIDVLGQTTATTLPSADISDMGGGHAPSLTGTDNAHKSTVLTNWTVALAADFQIAAKVTTPGAATWAVLTLYLTID